MSPTLAALLPVLIPTAAGAVALLFAARGASRATTAVTLTGLAGTVAAAAWLWRVSGGGELAVFDGALVLDRFGLAFVALIAGCAAVATCVSSVRM